MKRILTFFTYQFIFTLITIVNAEVELISPKNNGLAYNNNVVFSINKCPIKPSGFFVSNKTSGNLHFTSTNYKNNWESLKNIPIENNDILKIYLKCGNNSYEFERKIKNLNSEIEISNNIIKSFLRKNPIEKMKWDWGPAIFLYGLTKLDFKLKNSIYLDYIKNYHYHFQRNGLPKINWADRCPSALSAYYLKTEYDIDDNNQNINKVIKYIKNAKRNKLDSLNHFGSHFYSKIFPQSIWLDSLMMWDLLAIQYAKTENDKELLNWASKQHLVFASKLKHPSKKIYYHAWNTKKNRLYPKNNTFWLRGNGWVLASLIDSIEQLNVNDKYYNELVYLFKDLSNALFRLRSDNGLWDTLLGKTGKGYEEVSGSSLVAYAFLKGERLGLLDQEFKNLGKKTFSTIVSKYISKGKNGFSLNGISWSTMPYPEIGYKIIPKVKNISYGVGAFLMLTSEIL